MTIVACLRLACVYKFIDYKWPKKKYQYFFQQVYNKLIKSGSNDRKTSVIFQKISVSNKCSIYKIIM